MILDKEELKSKLKQLADIRKELSELEVKINKTESSAIKKDYVEASSKYFPYTKHKVQVEGVYPTLVNQLEKYKGVLVKRSCDLLKIQTELEQFISELPTSRLRRIFTYRYIEQMGWRKIAYKIGGIGGIVTEDSVRKEHDRFFENN